MNARLKSLIFILFMVGLYAVYYWIVPLVVNATSNTEQIKGVAKKELGIDIEIANPEFKMGLIPAIWLSASDFRLIEKGNNIPLNFKNAKLKIRLLPLIIGKIQVAYFSCDDLHLELKFDKRSRFYLGNYLFIGNSNPKLSLEDIKVNINNYHVHLNDELQAKNIYLKGDYFDLKKFNSKKHIKFSTDSELLVNKRPSIINADVDINLPFKKNFDHNKMYLEGSLTNFDLSDISPYVRKFSGNKIKKTEGVINLESRTQVLNPNTNRINCLLIAQNLNIVGADKISSIILKDKIAVSTIFDVSNNTLTFNKLQIRSERINSDLKGKISRITSKRPVLDLTINVDKSRAEDFIALIPATKNISKEINLIALKKYGYFGDVSGNLSIKGRSDRLNCTGKIQSPNGYIVKQLPDNTEKAKIKLKFIGKKLKMDIFVPTNNREYISINGTVDLFGDKQNNLEVKSSQNVDLKNAISILIPAHEIFRFELGPLPNMTTRGVGNVSLKIKGDKINPHLYGQVNFKNSTAEFNGIALPLTNINGTLKFEDQNTHFITQTALLNNKNIKIDGKCDFSGNLNFNIESKNQDLNALLSALNKSPMLSDINKFVEPIKSTKGNADISLNLSGKVKSIDDFSLGKTVFAKGKIKLYDNEINLRNLPLPIKNMSGTIAYSNDVLALDLFSSYGNSKLTAKGEVKKGIANITFNTNSLYLQDILDQLPTSKADKNNKFSSLTNSKLNINGKYIGPIDKINPNKLSFSGKILTDANGKNTDLVLSEGDVEFKNSTLSIKRLNGQLKNNPFNSTFTVKNLFRENQTVNGSFNSPNFDISALNSISKYDFSKKRTINYLEQISNPAGEVNLKIKVENNRFSTRVALNDISFTWEPTGLPIKIYSGVAELKNNKLNVYKVNSAVDSMPLLVDGIIYDLFSNPRLNIYLNSKPTQNFIEKYINTNALYPLKIKGDIIYSARLIGTKDNLNAKTEINLEKDSNIYYMGSTIGDANDPIRILLNLDILKNSIKVNNFRYQKLISSQNHKVFVSPQLSANGIINYDGKNIYLNNFGVKTQNPTDAKVFNILFKRPMIKQGQFTSSIIINGPITTPYIKGDANFTGINIPLLDTTIKDISLNFKNKTIDITAAGEIFANKITIASQMQNDLKPPYIFENIDVYLEDLDINKIMKTLNNLELEKEKHKISEQKSAFDVSDIIIKKAQVKADSVSVKNIYATNFLANLSLDEKLIFLVDKFQFDIADGKVKGDFKYNLLNSNSNLDMSISNVNANEMAYALFDLHDQIFGSLTGEVNLACNGKSHKSCMETLSGRGGFTVQDGKMPKLGSLEYLLKATNLVKSGVTGLSINGIIDLITPLKTGQFEMVNGSFYVESGIANSIQIFSKGKDLSLFINGTYNFTTLIADMNIFGRLSKKISTVLGPIGNASLNTLFNTIPGLNLDEENNGQFIKDINKIPGFELNDKMYRIFNAKIYGDINGENYVQSFKWVE